MSRAWSVILLAGVLAAVGCNKPKAEDCEEAIRSWFTLIYWEDAEKAIAAAPLAEREAVRAEKLADRDACLKVGLDLSVRQCRAAGDFKFIECMKSARTATAARACRPAKSSGAPCSRKALEAQGYKFD
jgi:hypothetical protein